MLDAQGGSDVITKTALRRINWSSYKINQSSDKLGVFVSIVSTKIPFKGAGKEYIGTFTPSLTLGDVVQAHALPQSLAHGIAVCSARLVIWHLCSPYGGGT